MLRSEREANANFRSALVHRVSHQSIESDDGKEQSAGCENSKQDSAEARIADGRGDVVLHGAEIHEWLIGIQIVDSAAQRGRFGMGIACCAQYHRHCKY